MMPNLDGSLHRLIPRVFAFTLAKDFVWDYPQELPLLRQRSFRHRRTHRLAARACANFIWVRDASGSHPRARKSTAQDSQCLGISSESPRSRKLAYLSRSPLSGQIQARTSGGDVHVLCTWPHSVRVYPAKPQMCARALGLPCTLGDRDRGIIDRTVWGLRVCTRECASSIKRFHPFFI